MAKRLDSVVESVFEFGYRASATLAKFHQDDSFIRGVMGPIGSGKSVGCCVEIFSRASVMPIANDGIRHSRWAIVRNTQPQLETTTIKTWLSWFPEHIFGKMNRKPPFTHLIRINDIELEVIFLALDKPEDVKKLLSLEVTGIWFNEAREIEKEILDAASGRVGRYPSDKMKPKEFGDNKWKFWHGVIMDTNPPDDTHWWYNCAEEDAWAVNELGELISRDSFPVDKRWKFFRQPSGLSSDAENIKHLPEGYYERLLAGKDKEWINVYVHGNYGFIKDGRPVYGSCWNDDLHVSDKVECIKGLKVYIGLDFGLTPCAIFGQKTARGTWHIFNELVTDDMDIDSFARLLGQEIHDCCEGNTVLIYGDPAGEFRDAQGMTVYELLKKRGLMARPAQTNNLEIRLQAVKSPLLRMIDGKPGFLLGKNCGILRRGFNGGYKFRRISSGGAARYTLEPDKNQFSHPHDALQYLLLGGGEFTEMRGRSNKAFKGGCMSLDFSPWK